MAPGERHFRPTVAEYDGFSSAFGEHLEFDTIGVDSDWNWKVDHSLSSETFVYVTLQNYCSARHPDNETVTGCSTTYLMEH